MDFGILHSIMSFLKAKVETMDEADRWCSVMIDEMELSQHKDFDVSNKCFLRNVTLGTEITASNHYSVVLMRGMKSIWK